MENILSHGKGAAFFPHISQGMLGPYQQLHVNITGCANMWGEYWDNLICTVRACWWGMAWGSGNLTLALTCRLSLLQHLAIAPQISPRRKMMPIELGTGILICSHH